jgi:predicted short-subunit dehydrogenase-like oxidoreductase (DUF2520 family)
LQKSGTTHALTGPISRGDVETIAEHIKAFECMGGLEGEIYKNLGLYTIDIAMDKKTIDKKQAVALSQTLRQYKNGGMDKWNE